MRSAYQNYEVFSSIIGDAEKKLYNDRNDLILKIIYDTPDYSKASVQELQSYSNQVGDILFNTYFIDILSPTCLPR